MKMQGQDGLYLRVLPGIKLPYIWSLQFQNPLPVVLHGPCPGVLFPRTFFQSSTSLLPSTHQLLGLTWY